jgi:hypothetical protein
VRIECESWFAWDELFSDLSEASLAFAAALYFASFAFFGSAATFFLASFSALVFSKTAGAVGSWAISASKKFGHTPASATRFHRLIMKFLVVSFSPPVMVALSD